MQNIKQPLFTQNWALLNEPNLLLGLCVLRSHSAEGGRLLSAHEGSKARLCSLLAGQWAGEMPRTEH